MRKLLFTLLVLLATVCQAWAVKPYGIVSDSNNEPLAFTNVYVQGTTVGTTTNDLGQYELNLKAGEYQVVYHYIGYTRSIHAVSMGSTDVELNVSLDQETVEIKEVVVTAVAGNPFAFVFAGK